MEECLIECAEMVENAIDELEKQIMAKEKVKFFTMSEDIEGAKK